METYGPMLIVAVVMMGMVGTLYFVLQSQNRIPIVGINHDTGSLTIRKCRPNKDGTVTFRGRDGPKCRIILEGNKSYGGARGRVFLADVTPGQGRVMYIKRSGEVLRMPGDRMEQFLDGGVVKDIGESSKTDINSLANKVLIFGGIAVVAILGTLAYIINKLGSGAVG